MKRTPKRFIALADSHGCERDTETIDTAIEFSNFFKPDLLIHLGDNWDLAALRGGASEADETVPLKPDIDAGKDTIDRFFGSYDPALKVYMWGNHELVRIKRHLKNPRAVVQEYAQMLMDELVSHVKRRTDESFPYCKRKGVFTWEGVNFLHGYSHGMYAAKKHAISYGNSIFGHIHCDSSYVLEDLNQSKSQSCPCACNLDMDYNASHVITLRQENGFLYGFLDESAGLVDFHVAKKTPIGYFLPTEMKG